MKNTKTKLLALGLSASFVLSSVGPGVAFASEEKLATSSYTQIDKDFVSQEKINQTISKAEDLKKLLNKIPSPLKPTYNKALDIIIKGLKNIDPEKAGSRLDLATESIEAIRFSIKDIQGKTKKAHVDIGFEITRAALVLANPKASNDQIAKAYEKLINAKEVAKNSDDIGLDDVATIYVKKDLFELIDYAKKLRKSQDLNENDLAELNFAIKKAIQVKHNPRTTVGEVYEAVGELQNVIDKLSIKENSDETIDPDFSHVDITDELDKENTSEEIEVGLEEDLESEEDIEESEAEESEDLKDEEFSDDIDDQDLTNPEESELLDIE